MRGKELSPFSSLKGISGPFPLPGAEGKTNICVLRTGAQLQQEKHKLKVNGEKLIFLGNLSLITPLKQLGLPRPLPSPHSQNRGWNPVFPGDLKCAFPS